jgi:hypothetical protein
MEQDIHKLLAQAKARAVEGTRLVQQQEREVDAAQKSVDDATAEQVKAAKVVVAVEIGRQLQAYRKALDETGVDLMAELGVAEEI